MKCLTTKRTYLEMRAPQLPLAAAPRADLELMHLPAPAVEAYRQLYSAVGQDYHWWDRIRMPVDELARIVQDQRVEIYVLKVAGEPAGYTELDRRLPGEIEIAYFGLLPQFIGQGLGKYLLAWTIARAWSYQPGRVWVHTCDLDHPAALPNYIRAGFVVYDERMIEQMVLESN